MVIYWGMLAWVGLVGICSSFDANVVCINGVVEKRIKLAFAIAVFSYIIIFAGLRSGIADTRTYINVFEKLPDSLEDLRFVNNAKEKGFTIFSVLIRQFISKDFHVWLFLIALISGLCTMIPLQKYSPDFGMSAFLFVSSCTFIWMFNGMRQYLVASILFCCTGLIIKKKTIGYLLILLILSTIHTSVLIALPVYFIAQCKPWERKTIFLTVLGIGSLILVTSYIEAFDSGVLNNTAYAGISEQFESDDGANFIRVLIAAVPVVLSWIYRKQIEEVATPLINICINMSVMTTGLYLVASLSSGILMGRLPIYFELYNLILLPWLLSKWFIPKQRPLAYFSAIVFYLLFFYYQIGIIWGGVGYISDILGLNL